jgi:hypothetical protein
MHFAMGDPTGDLLSFSSSPERRNALTWEDASQKDGKGLSGLCFVCLIPLRRRGQGLRAMTCMPEPVLPTRIGGLLLLYAATLHD